MLYFLLRAYEETIGCIQETTVQCEANVSLSLMESAAELLNKAGVKCYKLPQFEVGNL